MADFGGMVLTTQGLNLLAKAQTGAALDITRVAAGAGVWADDTNPEDVTALADERLSVPIQSMSVQGDGTVKLTVVISNSGLETGFIFRELGVFATDPDLGDILYAVAYSGDRYDYLPASVTTVEKVLDIYIVVGGAQNVTATISPGAILALKEDITAHEDADPAHPSTKIGFDNTTAVLAGSPDRAQSAIEALANELADAESGLAAHEAADPAHPASHISFDNSVAKLPGDPDRTQTALEALNANLIAAPYATLDYPTVCTADNRAGVTGAAAAGGGIVSLPAGVTIVLGEDLRDARQRPYLYNKARHWGVPRWARPLLDCMFDGQSDTASHQAQALLRDKYFRLQPALANDIAMDDARPQTLELLEAVARGFIAEQDAVIDKICEMLLPKAA